MARQSLKRKHEKGLPAAGNEVKSIWLNISLSLVRFCEKVSLDNPTVVAGLLANVQQNPVRSKATWTSKGVIWTVTRRISPKAPLKGEKMEVLIRPKRTSNKNIEITNKYARGSLCKICCYTERLMVVRWFRDILYVLTRKVDQN